MASRRFILGIALLLAGGRVLATAPTFEKQPRLIKDSEQAGLTYWHLGMDSLLEESTASAGLISAAAGILLLAREALKLKFAGRSTRPWPNP